MSLFKILIIDDDESTKNSLPSYLNVNGFEVFAADNIQYGEEILTKITPDLLLIDWISPGKDGELFIKYLREDYDFKYMPIIIITERSDDKNKIHGLEIGADDYMTKPFPFDELIARMNALLKRSSRKSEDHQLILGDIVLNTEQYRIRIGSKQLDVSSHEFKLMRFFMLNPDRVISRTELLNKIWKGSKNIDERAVDASIARLRKSLSQCGAKDYMQTVRGLGYRFSIQNN